MLSVRLPVLSSVADTALRKDVLGGQAGGQLLSNRVPYASW